MAETSSFVGSVISQSFSTFTSLLSMWGGWGGGGGGMHGGGGGCVGTPGIQFGTPREVEERWLMPFTSPALRIAQLFGACRRVADILLVIEELEHERLSSEVKLSETEQPATPRRGERMCDPHYSQPPLATPPPLSTTSAATTLLITLLITLTISPCTLRCLSNADIIAPDGHCLARDLSFSVGKMSSKSNLLITGPNGSGKSAVARVLCSLWQPAAGRVGAFEHGKPRDLGVIPQGPLVPTSALSLLEMMTYPEQLDSVDAEAAIATLGPLMQQLRVGYLADRAADGWHSVQRECACVVCVCVLCCVRCVRVH